MLHLTNLNLPYAYIIYLTYVISYITCHKFCYYTMLLTWDLFSWRPALNYWGPSVSISLNLVGIGTDVSFYLRKRCAGSWIEREFGKIRTRLDKIKRHLDIHNTRDSFTNVTVVTSTRLGTSRTRSVWGGSCRGFQPNATDYCRVNPKFSRSRIPIRSRTPLNLRSIICFFSF